MQVKLNQAAIRLGPHAPITLDHAQGSRIDCVHGHAWVTIDGDLRDIVLEAGESFRIEGTPRVVLQGLPCADVRLFAPQAAQRA